MNNKNTFQNKAQNFHLEIRSKKIQEHLIQKRLLQQPNLIQDFQLNQNDVQAQEIIQNICQEINDSQNKEQFIIQILQSNDFEQVLNFLKNDYVNANNLNYKLCINIIQQISFYISDLPQENYEIIDVLIQKIQECDFQEWPIIFQTLTNFCFNNYVKQYILNTNCLAQIIQQTKKYYNFDNKFQEGFIQFLIIISKQNSENKDIANIEFFKFLLMRLNIQEGLKYCLIAIMQMIKIDKQLVFNAIEADIHFVLKKAIQNKDCYNIAFRLLDCLICFGDEFIFFFLEHKILDDFFKIINKNEQKAYHYIYQSLSNLCSGDQKSIDIIMNHQIFQNIIDTLQSNEYKDLDIQILILINLFYQANQDQIQSLVFKYQIIEIFLKFLHNLNDQNVIDIIDVIDKVLLLGEDNKFQFCDPNIYLEYIQNIQDFQLLKSYALDHHNRDIQKKSEDILQKYINEND